MGRVLMVRNMKLGEGLPKICVPLTAANFDNLICAVRGLSGSTFDFVEWRADFYEAFRDTGARTKALQMLRNELGETPILFTIRTKEEGGQADISVEEYEAINRNVIETGLADLVDVELMKGDDVMKHLCASAQNSFIQTKESIAQTRSIRATCKEIPENNTSLSTVKIVGSRHDFQKTPDESIIIESLCNMQSLGADVAKFAVMPTCERDVLTLLSATIAMKESHNDIPFITMSMGSLGAVSRVCGSLTGSAVTFGTVGNASAPGQLPADLLKTFLEHLSI